VPKYIPVVSKKTLGEGIREGKEATDQITGAALSKRSIDNRHAFMEDDEIVCVFTTVKSEGGSAVFQRRAEWMRSMRSSRYLTVSSGGHAMPLCPILGGK